MLSLRPGIILASQSEEEEESGASQLGGLPLTDNPDDRGPATETLPLAR